MLRKCSPNRLLRLRPVSPMGVSASGYGSAAYSLDMWNNKSTSGTHHSCQEVHRRRVDLTLISTTTELSAPNFFTRMRFHLTYSLIQRFLLTRKKGYTPERSVFETILTRFYIYCCSLTFIHALRICPLLQQIDDSICMLNSTYQLTRQFIVMRL